MQTLAKTYRTARDLSAMEPWRAIAAALLFAFLLFLSLNLLQAALMNESPFSATRLLQFATGFISMSAGMLFVRLVMQRKEQELQRLRDSFTEQLQKQVKDIALLSVVDRRVLIAALWQERQDFLSVITHRLRTPVLANQRAATLMLQGAFGGIADQQKEILSHVIDNDRDINRLLDMLMAVYKYKNNRMTVNKRPCNLQAIAQECMQTLSLRAQAAGIAMDGGQLEPAPLSADGHELAILLCHLQENAIKHARTTVTVATGLLADNSVFASVTDDGAGMPPEDVANLFERFYLMSSTGKYAPATGIGLCLCAEIARAHGGTIECKSTVGQGTTFTVVLPVRPNGAVPDSRHRA